MSTIDHETRPGEEREPDAAEATDQEKDALYENVADLRAQLIEITNERDELQERVRQLEVAGAKLEQTVEIYCNELRQSVEDFGAAVDRFEAAAAELNEA